MYPFKSNVIIVMWLFNTVSVFEHCFIVMDKEHTMRAPKARSYVTHPNLHDRAGTFASVI